MGGGSRVETHGTQGDPGLTRGGPIEDGFRGVGQLDAHPLGLHLQAHTLEGGGLHPDPGCVGLHAGRPRLEGEEFQVQAQLARDRHEAGIVAVGGARDQGSRKALLFSPPGSPQRSIETLDGFARDPPLAVGGFDDQDLGAGPPVEVRDAGQGDGDRGGTSEPFDGFGGVHAEHAIGHPGSAMPGQGSQKDQHFPGELRCAV